MIDPEKADAEVGQAPSSIKADGTRVYLQPMLDGRTRMTVYYPDGTVESFKGIETTHADKEFADLYSPRTVRTPQSPAAASSRKGTYPQRSHPSASGTQPKSPDPLSKEVSAFWSWVFSISLALFSVSEVFKVWESLGTVESWGNLLIPGIALISLWKFGGGAEAKSFWGKLAHARFLGPLTLGAIAGLLFVQEEWRLFSYGFRFEFEMVLVFAAVMLVGAVPASLLLFIVRRTSRE